MRIQQLETYETSNLLRQQLLIKEVEALLVRLNRVFEDDFEALKLKYQRQLMIDPNIPIATLSEDCKYLSTHT